MTKKNTTKVQETAVDGNTSAAQTDTQATEPSVQLTIGDLQILAQVIDLASRRGAFQAGELSQVGEAYNKLAAFLSFVESTTKSAEQANDEPAAK